MVVKIAFLYATKKFKLESITIHLKGNPLLLAKPNAQVDLSVTHKFVDPAE
jgi:hypothetical protein